MELVLIRHGLPLRVENAEGLPADPPLSETGRQQAIKLAEWLETETIDAIYSSPLKRAYETAQPIATRMSTSIGIEAGLAEFDADASFYIPLEELKKTDYQSWKDFMEGGYQQPEEFAAFCERVLSAIESIVRKHRGQRVALVCHGGVINVWTAHVIGFEPRLFFNPYYSSINRYMVASSGERSVISLNLAAHLHH